MNEIIKQIEEESYVEVIFKGGKCQEFSKEKFAELIIKKCAVLANRAENNDNELRCMYDVITEHFGVKS